MKRSVKKLIATAGILVGIVAGMVCLKSCNSKETKIPDAPLLNNLGEYHLNITASSELASKYFTQGVIMANGFNHAEATRSFRVAIDQDSTCALAYWGLAYVLGPNYNTNSNQGGNDEILNAVKKASVYASQATPWEKALIEALRIKFPEDGSAANEEGFAVAMQDVYTKFPNNDFIVTLYAESMMNLHAWDLYTRKGGEPKPWTPLIVSTLEKAIELNPQNPLANHLYLHAVEAAPDVEKSLASAERLKTLVPGAGHLIHMPSHIYINTGDYHAGSIANEEAVKVDSIYITQCKSQGVYPQLYYPHNWHFLSATAALEGRGARSIEAAFQTANVIDKSYLKMDGFTTTQHYITIPYNVLVKFAQWEKILALPKPDQSLKYPNAIWHYARGMAYANTNKPELAKEELAELKILSEDEEVKGMGIWEINSAADICHIATHVLEGEIEQANGNLSNAAEHFLQAIAIEDQLNYNEPPDWFFSVRHYLGDVYLLSGKYTEAEKVFREDLSYWVKNGFALNGLYHSLAKQGKNEEAEKVKAQFNEAWQYADSQLRYARIDELKRKNLYVRIDDSTPNDLVYIAGTFCNN